MNSPSRRRGRLRGTMTLALVSALVLLVTGLGMSAYNVHAYKAQKAAFASAQAQILAATVTAALAFDDRASAQEYVDALRANPELEAAGAYDENGALVASFSRAGALPKTPPAAGVAYGKDRIVIVAPVLQGGELQGSVYLRSIIESSTRRIMRYAGITVLLTMAALVMLVLASAQGALGRVNSELETRAEDLAEANRLLQEQIEERERAEEALRQSQRLEAIGRITGGVAHDFNNLLMVASSGLELMERAPTPERRQALRDGIRQALDRGAGLTRQLLAFSRRTPLKTEVVDLRTHIDGMQVLLDHSLREDIAVRREVAADLWPVEIDSSQFELALLNIAVNARDAMPSGGLISICAQNRPGMREGSLEGDFVQLSVADQGGGMSAEVLSHVFEPFFTTKDVGKGTGLGLSQVYGFARSSGGEVRIDSREGMGTEVHLFIPRSMKSVAKPQSPPPRLERPGEGSQVLMVEDDDAVAAMVTDMLDSLGYRPVRAANAAAALRVLGHKTHFDLVFSDLVMPGGMDGIELAREIGRRRPELPILLTTGFSEAAAAAAVDGLHLLPKPYGIDALAAALEGVLSEHRRPPA